MGIIPEGELQRSFDHAFKVHTGSFPVSAYDMKDAYLALIEIERKANLERQEAARKDAEPKCDLCFDTGFQIVKRPSGENHAVKCDHGVAA